MPRLLGAMRLGIDGGTLRIEGMAEVFEIRGDQRKRGLST
ncbi:hypothetical protein PBI_MOLLY_91 [Mycobacterium phage Molly]|uniref:Uncharacterized protein n=1 Tax=Mycobacterium phage TwoPeat TaxID=3158882 RepID=A0AAU8GUB8_9CAUD|nr:hypothetical protein PBI_MOLLY_91 [Mycobacterium phage Molly]